MEKTLQFIFGFTLCTLSGSATSDQGEVKEYFGRFLDNLKGEFNIYAEPRPTFKLENEYRFIDPNGLLWSVPANTEVDGASIPPKLWSFIGGPFEGKYINASVVHDYYCRKKDRTTHDTHRNLYYGMRAAGVPDWQANVMYWAVVAFGPSWKIEKRIEFVNKCVESDGKAICSSIPVFKDEVVNVAPVDLSDPEVLAAALGKISAIARNQVTTKGKVIDVVHNHEIAADLDSINKNAKMYRETFVSKEFYNSPVALGVLSDLPTEGLAKIKPWSGNKLPKLMETPTLTPANMANMNEKKAFKLEASSKGLLEEQIDFNKLNSEMSFDSGRF